MVEPPFEDGAENAMLACALPAVAAPIVGAPGTVMGVTLGEDVDAALAPTEFVAITRQL